MLQELIDGRGADLRQAEALLQRDVDALVDRPDGEETEEREEDDQAGQNPAGDPEAEAQSLESTHCLTHGSDLTHSVRLIPSVHVWPPRWGS